MRSGVAVCNYVDWGSEFPIVVIALKCNERGHHICVFRSEVHARAGSSRMLQTNCSKHAQAFVGLDAIGFLVSINEQTTAYRMGFERNSLRGEWTRAGRRTLVLFPIIVA